MNEKINYKKAIEKKVMRFERYKDQSTLLGFLTKD